MLAYSQSRRVLVAEDDDTIRNLIRIVLDRYGYSVIEAADGEIAFELCCADSFDLIVLDVWMPKRDAWEVLDGLIEREALRRTPVIVLTAAPHAQEKAEHYKGVCETIMKPFDINELIAAVERCIPQAA